MLDFTSEPIAVTHPDYYLPTKGDLLLFDQIGIVGLEQHLTDVPADTASDLAWLAEKEVVFDASMPPTAATAKAAGLTPDELGMAVVDIMLSCAVGLVIRGNIDDLTIVDREMLHATIAAFPFASFIDTDAAADASYERLRPLTAASLLAEDLQRQFRLIDDQASERVTRLAGQHLRTIRGVEVVPLVPNRFPQIALSGHTLSSVLQVVLRNLPQPDESTPLEQILDFRADIDARRSLRRLQRWMRRVSLIDKPTRQIADELEDLLDQYSEHMRVHRMKYQHGIMTTVLISTAEALQNIMRLRFADALKPILNVQDRAIALLEAERTAPGRDVAYIVKAHEAFARRNVGA